ncbi:MAG: response regulator receiver protein [Ramlibacter sp.]|nr:response regulator receiver protein [Ramlibacter sp.]
MTSKKKLLLIDDDAAIIALLVTKLSKYYEIASTTEPGRAVAMARSQLPDAILCDIDMPKMSGGDVAAALAEDEATAGIPLIYLTALVSPEEAKDLDGQVGGRPGVSKRAPLSELVSRIDEAIRR